MPPANVNVALGTVGVVVISVAAAAAVAIYESPEVRQFAEDCRRKIAIALHSLGDEINPASRQPRFNRPEDAEGFLQSTTEAGLDGDEESRRKQREELMYWNQVRLERQEREAKKLQDQEENKEAKSPEANFEDFLHEDYHASEKGAFVVNTGANVHGDAEGLFQRRGQGIRGLERGNFYANPFADENNIEMEDVQQAADANLMSPESSEMSDDIYGLEPTTPTSGTAKSRIETQSQHSLVDVSEPAPAIESVSALPSDMYTSGIEAHPDAFASIHAWADNSQTHNGSSYLSRPAADEAALSETSEPEHISGELTPTDSASLAGSGEDVGESASVDGSRYYDVESEDEAGMSTPGSWTEVGSVVSEMDSH